MFIYPSRALEGEGEGGGGAGSCVGPPVYERVFHLFTFLGMVWNEMTRFRVFFFYKKWFGTEF